MNSAIIQNRNNRLATAELLFTLYFGVCVFTPTPALHYSVTLSGRVCPDIANIFRSKPGFTIILDHKI